MTHYRKLMASCGIVGLLFLCVFLSACAGIIVGGAATSAVVANDPRTTGTFVEDQSIELRSIGTFFKKEIKEKKSARNPKTGELIYVPKKFKVRFRASKNLKNLIN